MPAGFSLASLINPAAAPMKVQRHKDKWHAARRWHTLTWAVIGAGICLRLFHFFHNRSLWIDESFLANNLVRLGFAELVTGPLEYEQKAPIGYLLLSKLSVVLFGKGEMALRLVSLLSSIASLLLLRSVARRFLTPAGVFVALAILAITPPSVYYSVEAKQYCTEMLATVMALYLYVRYHEKITFSALLLWGLLGAVLIWFSYSVIFVLAGMAIAAGLTYLFRKDWTAFFRSAIPFSLWLVSFGVNYLLFTQKHAGSGWLIDWFADMNAFIPFPPASLKDWTWLGERTLHVLHFTLGLTWIDLYYYYNLSEVLKETARMPWLPLLCWVSGLVLVYRQNRQLFWVFTLPLLLVLLASAVRIYPFHERLTYFLVPLIIILMARSFEQLLVFFSSVRWRYALMFLLLAGAAANSAYLVVRPELFGRPYKNYTARQALLYVNEHYQPGDVVYVYWNFKHFYRYYSEAYELKYTAILGSDMRFASKDSVDYAAKLNSDLKLLTGSKRVWLIHSKIQREAIGDPFGKPEWYYNQQWGSFGKIMYNKLLYIGKEEATFETLDMKASLFIFYKHKYMSDEQNYRRVVD
jgi:hypothetical protein